MTNGEVEEAIVSGLSEKIGDTVLLDEIDGCKFIWSPWVRAFGLYRDGKLIWCPIEAAEKALRHG